MIFSTVIRTFWFEVNATMFLSLGELVFYLLLKNNETLYWKFVIILIIEYIQFLSYSFDETVRFPRIYRIV